MTTFGERLRELRKAQGISQRDLAELVDLDFTFNGFPSGLKCDIIKKNVVAQQMLTHLLSRFTIRRVGSYRMDIISRPQLFPQFLQSPSDTRVCSVCKKKKHTSQIHNLNDSRLKWIICKTCAAVGKHCPRCGNYQLFAGFPKGVPSCRGGAGTYCLPCNRELFRQRYYANGRKKPSTAKRQRELYLSRQYGLTEEQYQIMFDRQNGLCAVCGQPETGKDKNGEKVRSLSIDHNHQTGTIRDLLCMHCNHLLGLVEKDRELTKKLLEYLHKHDESEPGQII